MMHCIEHSLTWHVRGCSTFAWMQDINMASTERENTLKAIKSQIQERLDTERKAQISAVKKLEEIRGDDEVREFY